MGFIAGYVGNKPKYESALLEERVRSYVILPGEESADYYNIAIS